MDPMRPYPLTPAICAAVLLAIPAPSTAGADTVGPLAELVDAAAQRLQLADDVAAAKWHTRTAIEDPARADLQLTALTATAETRRLDVGYVRRVFIDQIGATEAVEHYRVAQWTLDPAAAPADPPDLGASRTRIDDLNQVMLTRIEQSWPQLHAPQCRSHLEQATRDVGAARGFDGFARQALSAATHSYCAG